MSVPVAFIDRLQLAHQIGREIVEAFDHPDMISDAVNLIASRLECMGVGITFFNHSDRVCPYLQRTMARVIIPHKNRRGRRNRRRYRRLGDRTRRVGW